MSMYLVEVCIAVRQASFTYKYFFNILFWRPFISLSDLFAHTLFRGEVISAGTASIARRWLFPGHDPQVSVRWWEASPCRSAPASDPSITTWFCGSRVCFSMSALGTWPLRLEQVLYSSCDGWWCFLSSYKLLAPIQTWRVLVWSRVVMLEPRGACASPALCIASAKNATGGGSTCLNGLVRRNLSVKMLLFLSVVRGQIIFSRFWCISS